MPQVLVTDASERAALAAIRSLGKRGIDVAAGDSATFNMGFLSRYCKRRILYPAPEREKTQFVKALLRHAKKESFDLLIPITDTAMVPIIERKEDFEKYTKVASPDYSIAAKVLDKIETVKLAQRHGVSCPATRFGEEFDDANKFARELKYPVVIRPRMKVAWIGERALILKVTEGNYAYNAPDFIAKWNRLTSLLRKVGFSRDFLMVQEFVKGDGYGVEALMSNGKPKAIFMHRRIREYPTTGGASTLRVSVEPNEMADSGIRLLQAIGWEGVAMVEFRVNARTRKSELIEVNGRFWGSLPLALSCGVDFPYLLYKCLQGEDFARPSYTVGLKQRWLAGDFLWLYSSLFKGNGLIRAMKEFLGASAVADDIAAIDDMVPVCGQLLSMVGFLSKVASGHRNLYGEILP